MPVMYSRGDFLSKKNDERGKRERELAKKKNDENRRAARKIKADKIVVETLNPMRDKNEGTCQRGEGTTPVTSLRAKPLTS